MHRRLGRSAALASITVALLMIPAFPAFAASSGTQPAPPSPAQTQRPAQSNNVPLTDNGASRGASAAGSVSPNSLPIGVSPAGCTGQTDYAHKSGTQASVHGRTTCTFFTNGVGVTTYLWNLAWFGWVDLNSGTSSRPSGTTSYDATPHSACASTDPHSFFGSSSHYSIEGSTTYTGSTASPTKVFNC